MDYKKELLSLLDDLKNMNHDRRLIEKNLGYKEKYLDQVLSKGGNKTIIIVLKDYKKRVEAGEQNSNLLNDPSAIYGLIKSNYQAYDKDFIVNFYEHEIDNLEKRIELLDKSIETNKNHNTFLQSVIDKLLKEKLSQG